MPIKFADVLRVEMWGCLILAMRWHKKLREAMNKLLKETDEEKLRLTVNPVRNLLRLDASDCTVAGIE